MAQVFTKLAAESDITPSTSGSYVDVDVTSYLPAGATGAIIHIYNDDNSNRMNYSIRKNGSTDDQYLELESDYHTWAIVGVDTNRIFEVKLEDYTAVRIRIAGYTTSGITILTNSVDKTPGSLTTWTDMDCAAQAPSAVGLIFKNVSNVGSAQAIGIRKNGSTDARVNTTSYGNMWGGIVGCDGSQIAEGYIGHAGQQIHITGYITAGVTLATNATEISLTATGAWTNLTALAAGSVIGIIEYIAVTASNDLGLRMKGESTDLRRSADKHNWAFIFCSTGLLIEGHIVSTGQDFFILGTGFIDTTVVTVSATGIGQTAAILNGFVGVTVNRIGFVRSTTTQVDPGNTDPALSTYSDYIIRAGSWPAGSLFSAPAILTPNTTYYFRAVVRKTSDSSWAYGEELSFTTLSTAGWYWVEGAGWHFIDANSLEQTLQQAHFAKAFAKIDLSAAAVSAIPILHTSRAATLLKAIILYTEASSADAGVTIEIGKESDADYYYTGASETSQSLWYEKDVTLLQTDVGAGDTVICGCAGGKTGAGEVLIMLEYKVN